MLVVVVAGGGLAYYAVSKQRWGDSACSPQCCLCGTMCGAGCLWLCVCFGNDGGVVVVAGGSLACCVVSKLRWATLHVARCCGVCAAMVNVVY